MIIFSSLFRMCIKKSNLIFYADVSLLSMLISEFSISNRNYLIALKSLNLDNVC